MHSELAQRNQKALQANLFVSSAGSSEETQVLDPSAVKVGTAQQADPTAPAIPVEPPSKVPAIVRSQGKCVSVLSQAVTDNGGTVVKTIGDEVLATFPAAEAAVLASAYIVEAVGQAFSAPISVEPFRVMDSLL